MKKNLVFLVLVALLLSGCDSSSELNSSGSLSSVNDESSEFSQPVIFSSELPPESLSTVSNTESESQSVENAVTDLFDEVYLPYAKREYSPNVDDVTAFVESCGFENTTSSDNGFTEIKVLSGEDYVYFAFTPRSINDSDTFTIISYYQGSTKSEVSLNNYSSNGSYEYDMLQTHILGDSNKDVANVDEQRSFLFGV